MLMPKGVFRGSSTMWANTVVSTRQDAQTNRNLAVPP